MATFTPQTKSSAATLTGVNKSTSVFTGETAHGKDVTYDSLIVTYDMSTVQYEGDAITWTKVNKN